MVASSSVVGHPGPWLEQPGGMIPACIQPLAWAAMNCMLW